MTEVRNWYDIEPKDAVDLDLSTDMSINAPLNEMGERCPWPWEPQQLKGAPMGQYRCPFCMAMCMAGMAHIDYRTESGRPWLEEVEEEMYADDADNRDQDNSLPFDVDTGDKT